MKKSFLMSGLSIFVMAVAGCGGGGSSNPPATVDISNLDNGYSIEYQKIGINTPSGVMQFCGSDYIMTGYIESNGTFEIDSNLIVFHDTDDFQLLTTGELVEDENYEFSGISDDPTIQITHIEEIDCI
ncbi:MAG: hypothetical protein IE885_01315 [Campylobacterales bacterium]|nr:hypothetical protein [Campylobacterales bacterium]